MKKIIQIVSFLGVIFVLSGVEAGAQSTTKIDVNVPFDFVVGGQVFEAGKYQVRVRRDTRGADTIELRDSKYRIVYEGFALQNGDPGDGKAHMIFDRSQGIAQLSKIRTGDRGYSVPLSENNDAVTLAAKKKKDQDVKN